MAKELYLYSPIYDFVAQDLIAAMEDNKSEDIVIRSNTPGGSVFAGWGIIAKMGEMPGKVTIKADGMVASMGLYMLLFADHVEALDVTRGLLHRADGPVSSPEDQAFLDDVNAQLKTKLTAKINSKKLKELKGVSINDIFNPESRIDVLLTGKEMKDIGLVDKITKVNPTEVKAFNERMFAIAAEHAPKPNINPNSNIMTVAEIKAQHPALYAEIFGLGVTAGTSEERDRVGSWLPFASVDAELVSKSIKEGTKLSASAMSEMNVKMISAQGLKKIEADAPGAVKTEEPKTEKDKGVAAFEASVDKALGKKAIA